MSDLISRQDAIDAAENIIAKHEARMVEYSEYDPHTSGKDTHMKHSNRADGAEEVLRELYTLPSAELKREECEEREQGLCPFYAG